MLNDINKSKLSFEKYVELKGKTIVKSYSERFKWVDKFMYVFAWFGNAVSIFLAFFFLQSLFYASFNNVSKSVWITAGIVFFLVLFELLKRYVFGMFSLETIKQRYNIFKGSTLTFLTGTLLIVAGSFYLSLNGAKEFVDNQKIFETQAQHIVASKVDSLQRVFNEEKMPLVNENKNLRVVNDTLRNKLARTPVTYRTVRREYQTNINNNVAIINQNQKRIDDIDARTNKAVEELKQAEQKRLSSNLEENRSNMITFIIISSIIEIIIMIGIFFDKFYDWKTLQEYEETVINTPEFKTWYKYNYLLELIYNSTKEIGDKIPTSNNLMEMAKIGKSPVTKGELDKFIKILYYLDVVVGDGNKRILNVPEKDGKGALRNYFNIK